MPEWVSNETNSSNEHPPVEAMTPPPKPPMVTDAEIEAAVTRMRRADERGWAEFNAAMLADRERTLGLAERCKNLHWIAAAVNRVEILGQIEDEARDILKEAHREA